MSLSVIHDIRARSLRLAVVVAMLTALVAVPAPAMAAFDLTAEVEPNDVVADATSVLSDGSIAEAAIDPMGDVDYYEFPLVMGTTYKIETGPSTTELGLNYDIVMSLFDRDGTTTLDSDDDGGAANFSYIEYTPAVSGMYYARIQAFSHPNTTGIYGFRVSEVDAPPVEGIATMSGVVTDEEGPVEGVEVQDYLVDPWFGIVDSSYRTPGLTATTGADGSYEMTVSAGAHVVEFINDGTYYEQWFDGQLYMENADLIDLAADDITTTIDAVLETIPPLESRVLETARASLDADGQEYGDGGESRSGSRSSDVSADGQYVVFYSGAPLVPEDDDEYRDWFRKDLTTGEIELVSVNSDEEQANADYDDGSGKASISADGRFVAFDSEASNLDVEDYNDGMDVFVRDMQDGVTTRVSYAPDLGDGGIDGGWEPSISGDGEYVVFNSDSALVSNDIDENTDIYMYEMESGEITRVSEDDEGIGGDNGSWDADVNEDGTFVAFLSDAGFVDDDSGDYTDVYVKDIEAGTFERADVGFDGSEANDDCNDPPAINGDGTRVVFDSDADNLVDGDANEVYDIFVRDFTTGETTMVSVNSDGMQTYSRNHDPAISADGRFVAFSEVSGGKGGPIAPAHAGEVAPTAKQLAGSIKPLADSDLVETLVAGDMNDSEDIILHDTADKTTTMVSLTPALTGANDDSEHPALSADGGVVTYHSDADDLVADDGNGVKDVFAATIDPALMEPLDGPDRYETAIKISQDQWPDGSEYVVIARGDLWPDALGGSALAGVTQAPVLLTDSFELTPAVADEITRLGATSVFVLGGPVAVSEGVFTELEDLLGQEGTVTRLGGIDRYETAEIVADEVVSRRGVDYDGMAFVATGENFADALAASPIAAANGWPVYLAPHPRISDQTVDAMLDAGVTDCILLGGDAAMPEDTNVVILAAGFDALRIDGSDRYETASKVAGYGVSDCGLSWGNVGVATGLTFPDALAGGAAQGLKGSVMLLATRTAVPAYTADSLTDNKSSIGTVRFLGGLNALSQDVRDEIYDILH